MKAPPEETVLKSFNSALKKYIFNLRLRPRKFVLAVHQLTLLSEWCRENKIDQLSHFEDRFQMFEHLNVGFEGPIDYLEFGVFKGSSIQRWMQLNAHPNSRFYGFDTFTGLPEPWEQATNTLASGYFSTEGKLPDISDERAQFVPGRFQDSLEPFLRTWTPRSRLVVHLDADLYSATLFVLCALYRQLRAGTILLFDEFGSVNHEFRAFSDFTSAFPIRTKPIAFAGRFYTQMAFEVL